MESFRNPGILAALQRHHSMAAAKKKTARGHKQDRARVAGGQKYEVRYVEGDWAFGGRGEEGGHEGSVTAASASRSASAASAEDASAPVSAPARLGSRYSNPQGRAVLSVHGIPVESRQGLKAWVVSRT